MEVSGRTKVCGVIGYPIKHTFSPTIHNAAFAHLKLDFVYVAFQVKTEELENAISGVRSLGIHGLNVTMPHKNAVVRYLNEMDPTAKFMRGVNTILNNNGRLVGFNTDGVGAMNALKENGVNLNGKKMLLLGAGGAANAIAFEAAQEVEELTILNRTPEKAKKLAEILVRKFRKRIEGNSLSEPNINKALQNTNVLINATSVGMHPNVDRSLVAPEWLRSDLCVMDIIYNPLETKLAKDARSKGAKVIDGIEMLIYQGAASFEVWTNHAAPVKVMKQAISNQLPETGAIHYGES
jgi:shikimate dehydrogenase